MAQGHQRQSQGSPAAQNSLRKGEASSLHRPNHGRVDSQFEDIHFYSTVARARAIRGAQRGPLDKILGAGAGVVEGLIQSINPDELYPTVPSFKSPS